MILIKKKKKKNELEKIQKRFNDQNTKIIEIESELN